MLSLLLMLALGQPALAQDATTEDDATEPTAAPAEEEAAESTPVEAEATEEAVEGEATEEAPAEGEAAEEAPEGEAAEEAPEGEAPAEEPTTSAAEALPTEPPEESLESWQRNKWGWGGFPYVIYNSDDGVNVGIIGSVYKYNGKTAPYKTRIGGLFSFTSKGILYDYIDVDALELAGGKLRLTTRVLFDSRFSEPFCGIGGDVMCDDDLALEQMADLGVPEDARDDSLKRWYQAAFRHPYALMWARYELSEMPHRVELIGSYRLSYFHPFQKFDYTYFSESLDLDDQRGFTSVLQAGIMADNRDNEPTPFRGYWIEGTVRGASKFWGSQFDWFGFNTTLRGYVPILAEGRLTLADRFAFDGIVGEPNMKELDWMGGYQMYSAAGGARSVRGIRSSRYRGKVKILNQAELRWRFARATPGTSTIDFYLQAYLDAAIVAADWDVLEDSPIQHGEGGGLRIAFNQNFVLRGDFATSGSEGWGLSGIYLDVDNLW